MEAITVKAIAAEAARECIPARVQAVTQSSPRDIVLTLGSRSGRYLFISIIAPAPSVHLLRYRPPAADSPTAFCRLLRKRLIGLVLTGIESPGMERTLHCDFATAVGAAPECRLAAELTGRWANIILVDAQGTVVDSMHHVPEGGKAERPLLPGLPYGPPPSGGRTDLEEVGDEAFAALWREWKGGGPHPSTRLIGLGPGLSALAGEDDDPARFLAAVRESIAAVRAGRCDPAWYPGRRRLLPLAVPAWEGEERGTFPTMSEAAAAAYRELAARDERGALAGPIRRELSRRRARLARKVERLEVEAGEESGREEELLRLAGQALLTVLADVPRGTVSFEVPDPEDPGGAGRSVTLDPALGPRQNAERFFRKAKKAHRRSDLARRALPAARRELARVEEELAGFEDLPLAGLRELARRGEGGKARPAAAGVKTGKNGRGPKGGGGAKQGKRPKKADRGTGGVREYADGRWRILVGRNSRGNDYLTSKIAHPEDYWFHARDCAGAHVVLKSAGEAAEPPPEALRAAAEAAAWHSAAKGESKADVSYTRRKHVRKVKGQAAGKVLVPRSQTLRVRPRVPAGFREAGKGRGES